MQSLLGWRDKNGNRSVNEEVPGQRIGKTLKLGFGLWARNYDPSRELEH